jgi:hypothetical protein
MSKSQFFYTNIWLDKGREYQTETQVCTTEEQAIADYKQNVGTFKYSHTKRLEIEQESVIYPHLSWYSEVDITDFIETEDKPESLEGFDEDAVQEKRKEAIIG